MEMSISQYILDNGNYLYKSIMSSGRGRWLNQVTANILKRKYFYGKNQNPLKSGGTAAP